MHVEEKMLLRTDRKNSKLDLTIVLPVYNEVETIPELYRRLKEAVDGLGVNYEIIFVDDGSTDGSGETIKKLAQGDPAVTLITFRKNFGQTAALAAGFDCAKGEIIVTLDADLQNDPFEIPKFIKKIEDGYDIVSGWRKTRKDSFWLRRLPSYVANWLMRKLSKLEIHDFGCTLKAYRKDIVKRINLYGELHRFIPALAANLGARIAEIPVQYPERPYGESKYGLKRTFTVIFDLITIKFLLSYLTRPLQFFGLLGLFCFLTGFSLGIYMLVDKFYFGKPIMVEHGPLALLMVLLIVISFSFISLGLLGEVLARIYYEGTGKKIYSIREIWKGSSSY